MHGPPPEFLILLFTAYVGLPVALLIPLFLFLRNRSVSRIEKTVWCSAALVVAVLAYIGYWSILTLRGPWGALDKIAEGVGWALLLAIPGYLLLAAFTIKRHAIER